MEIIKTSVTQTVGSLPLKQKFGYDDLALLFATLRSEVDKKLFENSENFLGFLLPTDLAGEREVLLASGAISESEPESTCLNKEFRVLLDETKDFIECPDFALVRSKALDSMMELLFMDLKERLAPNAEVTTSRKLSDSTDTLPDILVGDKNDHGIAAQPLAKLLPILAQLAAPALRSNSNPYLRELAQCKEMQAFSAIVYSSFDILD